MKWQIASYSYNFIMPLGVLFRSDAFGGELLYTYILCSPPYG